MSKTFRSRVIRAKRSTPWRLANEVLYDLCQRHPLHSESEVILAKILLIGRTYSAAIERRRTKAENNEDFYLKRVVPKIRRSHIDRWISKAKAVEPESLESLEVMVEVHSRTTSLFSKISGLEKRSLASKYLHFHVPRLFFIYDSRAIEGLRAASELVGTASSYAGDADREYRKFAEKCWRLQQYCATTFQEFLLPREIDNLLLLLQKAG